MINFNDFLSIQKNTKKPEEQDTENNSERLKFVCEKSNIIKKNVRLFCIRIKKVEYTHSSKKRNHVLEIKLISRQ